MGRTSTWGQRVTWAKQYFEMIPPSLDSPLVDTPIPTLSRKAQAKQRKVVELHPDTTWQCRRCGWMEEAGGGGATASGSPARPRGALPRHPITGRPEFTRLADHLEWKAETLATEVGMRSSTVLPSLSPPPCCTAGRLCFVNGHPAEEQYEERPSIKAGDVSPIAHTSPTKTLLTTGKKSKKEAALPPLATPAVLRDLLSPPPTPMPSWTNKGDGMSSGLQDSHLKLLLVLDNPKTPRNLGSIIRALGCFAFAAASQGAHHDGTQRKGCHPSPDTSNYQCGILFTGDRLLKALLHQPLSAAGTDTQDIRSAVALYQLESYDLLWEAVSQTRARGTSVHLTAVDLIADAQPLHSYVHPFPPTASPSSHPVLIYLFGAEDGSVPASCLPHCNDAVFIPTIGSLNLSAALTVLLYDRTAKRLRCLERAADDKDTAAREPNHKSRRTENMNGKTTTEEAGSSRESETPPSPQSMESHRATPTAARRLQQLIMQQRNVNNKLEWKHQE